MDGTLLNEEFRMTEDTFKFITEAKEKGYKLGIITGRPSYGIKSSLTDEEFALFDFFGSYNGARVEYNNEIVEHKISTEILSQISGPCAISTSDDLGNFYVNDYKIDGDITGRYKSNLKRLEEIPTDDIYFVRLIFNNAEDTQKTYEDLIAKGFGEKYFITVSTGTYILITAKGISKGHVIREFTNENDKVYFFGDSENDVSAFEVPWVISVATSNAAPVLKKMAKIILKTTNDETLRIEFDD